MTVYVVQESPGKNLLPAAKFGNVEVLLPPGQLIFDVVPTIAILREKLENYRGKHDYLVMIGDPIAIALASLIAGEFDDTITFLKWDKQERQYVAVKAEL